MTTSGKGFNQVSRNVSYARFLHVTDVFFRNKNRLLMLSDTCSYIDRLGSVDSPRPRNHPFEAGAKFNPLSLFTLAFDSRQVVPRFGEKNFLPRKRRLRHTSFVYFQRTLKAALILSYIEQHCAKIIIMSYHELVVPLHGILSSKNTFVGTLQFVKLM